MPTVLITGGTRGIGLALGKAFAQKGWSVEACYHQDEASASSALKELQAFNPSCQVSRCDVRQPAEVQAWVSEILGHRDTVECGIHNAGVTYNARLLNTEESQWDETLQTHLKGAFNLSQALLIPMIRQKNGHLLFISSIVASTGNIGQGAYTAAKAGLVGLARSLAREYGSRNIRVNVVNPGFHKTRLAQGLSPEAEQAILSRHLLGRHADLVEVCQFILWLAGSQSVSGQVFNLDSRIPGWL
jgi:3-oxoacyl-[acyl-carrier protein] reductase